MGSGGSSSGAGRSRAEGRRAPTAATLHDKLKLQDLSPAGERVLVRVDFNVPVEDGRVTDRTRIAAALPTLRHLLRAGAAVIAMSHRGRPKGERRPELSMRPVAEALADELRTEVELAPDCVGEDTEKMAVALEPGRVLLLENLRFHAGERANDEDFADALAQLGSLYVNDAFGASHRAHASIVAVPARLRAAAGDLLSREVAALSRVLVQPSAPFALVLGGAKVSDKVGVVRNLVPLIDRLLIGGAMANAFLAARGRQMGDSLAPEEAVEQAGAVMELVESAGVELHLPTDLVVASSPDTADDAHVVEGAVPDGEMALDIGPDSRERFTAALSDAETIVWNGPMGVFEKAPLDSGTRAVAEAIAARGGSAFTVLGGGDTAAAAAKAGISQRVSHVSTGGGASLELLSGAILPGVAALTDRAEESR